MNTNHIIIKLDQLNAFRLNMDLDILDKRIKVLRAHFDTGCNTSVISLNRSVSEIEQTSLLYSPNIKVTTSFGVEGKINMNDKDLQHLIKYINNVKNDYHDREKIKSKLKNIEEKILSNIHIRYVINAHNIFLNKMRIPDTNILIAYNLSDVNLIGMNIIKQLRTQIYTIEKGTYLTATLNGKNADDILEDNLYIDLLEQTQNITTDNSAVRANYIHKEIEKYMI